MKKTLARIALMGLLLLPVLAACFPRYPNPS
jgi:hypothetical protein